MLACDGGLTIYNSPAYLAFQMATDKPYHINWNTGVDRLLIVSVGTGNPPVLARIFARRSASSVP